jgi:conjugative transfer signal peptidase TraF
MTLAREELMRASVHLIWFASAALVAGFIVCDQAPAMVIYNPTPSMPIGFYTRTAREIAPGAIVTVRADTVSPSYARARGAGPEFQLLKRVAAASGDIVCATDQELIVNGSMVATRQRRDNAGRELPWWSGCQTLEDDQLLLLGESETSFDGRYFGVVSAAVVDGVWRPLLITEAN